MASDENRTLVIICLLYASIIERQDERDTVCRTNTHVQSFLIVGFYSTSVLISNLW